MTEDSLEVYSLFLDGRFDGVIEGHPLHVIKPTLEAWKGDAVPGVFDDTFWLHDGQVRKRLPCPVVAEGLWLKGVPAESIIVIQEQEYVCEEGGDVELSFQYPGTYTVTVQWWPYLDGVYEIENTPQVE